MDKRYEKVIRRFNNDVMAVAEANVRGRKEVNPNLASRFNRLMTGDTWKNFIENEKRAIPPSVYKNYDFAQAQRVSTAIATALDIEQRKVASLHVVQPSIDDEHIYADDDEQSRDDEHEAMRLLKDLNDLR